jgi:hypothetical protein
MLHPVSLGAVADTCLQIYGCEYQSLVISYAGLCQLIMTLPVPYWPAPDNAPGSCSCNTGEFLETYLGSQTSELSCAKNAELLSLGEIPARLEACACCGTGITISAYVLSTVFWFPADKYLAYMTSAPIPIQR